MTQAQTTLREIYNEWVDWAASAPRDENGWQEFFPRWPVLLHAAQQAMVSRMRDDETLGLLEKCWELSEESEELADFAREHTDETLDVLVKLAKSEIRDVRWQAYSVLPRAGATGEAILREALRDPDPYCRRRAYLAIAEMSPRDAFDLAAQIIDDKDFYMRLAAVDLVRACGQPKLIAEAKTRLLADPNPYVRQAAQELLP